MRKACGFDSKHWRELSTRTPLCNSTLTTLCGLVDAIEACFTPGNEPTLREWYRVEDLLMPVWQENKGLRNLRRLKLLRVPDACKESGTRVSDWWEWEVNGGIPEGKLPAVAQALLCHPQTIRAMDRQHARQDWFARWLYRERCSRGISDACFCARVRIPRHMLNKWESGHQHIPGDRLVRIARALDLPIDHVLREYHI